MDIRIKLDLLDRIYEIYDSFTKKLNVICEKYCASCCTRNVTLTTLEGYRIVDFILSKGKSEYFGLLEEALSNSRFIPRLTTNMLADYCMEGRELPEEREYSTKEKCPLLENNACLIYPVRPFACRSLVSTVKCEGKGYASIDDFALTVNTVFQQYLEHVDATGFSGNLADILVFLQSQENQPKDRASSLKENRDLISNQPITNLFISPEHRNKMKPLLKALHSITIPKKNSP